MFKFPRLFRNYHSSFMETAPLQISRLIPGPEVLEGNRKSKNQSRKRRNSEESDEQEGVSKRFKRKRISEEVPEEEEQEEEESPSLL